MDAYVNNVNIIESANFKLERMYIEEYLKGLGHSYLSMPSLPEEIRKPLMAAACVYASCKLAEIENRAIFVRRISYT